MSLLRNDLWRTAAAGICVALAAFLSGCSGDDTASNSPSFDVADGNEANPSAADRQPEAAPQALANGSSPPPTAGGQGASEQPLAQPPADPGLTLDAYQPPEGDAEELLTFMRNIDRRMPQGESQAERLADVIQMQRAIIEAADKVADLPDLTEEQTLEASHRKISAFATLDELGVEGVGKEVEAYLAALEKSGNVELQQLSKLVALNRAAVDLLEGTIEDPAVIANQMKQLLTEVEANETVFQVTSAIAYQLGQAGFDEASDQSYTAIREKFGESDDPRIQAALAEHALTDRLETLQFNEKLQAVMKEEQGAVEAFMAAVQQVVQNEPPSEILFEVNRQSAQILESTGHYVQALQIMRWTEAALAKSDDERLKERAATSIQLAEKRLTLIGKQLPIAGMVALDGEPFDWNAYRGQVVLIDFWASWCGPCIAEFPRMKELYAKYQPKGFEILGVNLDDTNAAAAEFLQQQPLPWRTVVSSDPEAQGFDNKAAVFAGVESIPFMVLVGPDGVVRELHVRGQKLETRLEEIFGPIEPAPGQGTPQQAAPDGDPPVSGGAPAPGGTSRVIRQRSAASSFVSLLDDTADESASASAAAPADEPAAAANGEEREFAEIKGIEIDESINPYAPNPGLSKLELAQFILEMRDKPASIQRRPGFADGLLEACDLLIEETGGKGRFYEIAVLEKLSTLHRAASFGDAEADAALAKFVESLGEPDREKIALEVAFHKIEQRLIEAAESESADVGKLLEELAAYYAEEELTEKHLRMASSTVKAINKIEDGTVRESHFQEFGKLFAASKDKELARYGKRIAKAEGSGTDDLVGKPIELAGVTASGLPLDWNSYRGKVVIVDFWATWCGPCRREMPKLQGAYAEHRDAGLEVIGISLDQDLEALAEYLAENNIVWPMLIGAEADELATRYNVRGIPAMLLIDAEGNCVAAGHNLAGLMPQAVELLKAPKGENEAE